MLATIRAFKSETVPCYHARLCICTFLSFLDACTHTRRKKSGIHYTASTRLPSLVISTLYFFPSIVFSLLHRKRMYYSWVRACSSPALLPPPGTDSPPDLGGWHQDERIFFWPWHLCSWGAGVQHWPGGVRERHTRRDQVGFGRRQSYMHAHFIYKRTENKPALF